MAYQAAIVGASGYTGAELARLCAGHPGLDVVALTGASNAGARLGDLFPALAAHYGDARITPTDAGALDGLDLVFLALPHGESQRIAGALIGRVGHIVDLGADFRLPPATYAEWYGEQHQAPELTQHFAFGMVELFRDQIRAAQHVAAPGCYPTAASLALAPLVAGGFIEPTGIVVNAVSGTSGAGRALKLSSHFAEANESVSAYGLLTHRHTAEIEFALSARSQHPVQVLFQPHLVPMTRGILATCYARPARAGLSSDMLLAEYRAFYADEPFVVVGDEPAPTKAAYGANTAHVSVRFDPRTGSVLAFGAIDNLVKGASGQALQNANLLFGLPETTGLSTIGVVP
jgi:N-acetyl-gamma-glutamyl-phosphate reductase